VSIFFSFFSPLFLSPSWFPCLSLQLFKVAIPFVFPSTLIHVFFITIFYIKGLIKLGLYSFNSLQLYIFDIHCFDCYFLFYFFYFLDLFCFINFEWLRILLHDFFYLSFME
jgi:hypothetical protein